ncbi:hypothetical protein ACVJGD_008515 [Bradyrhizobium sp. USDA 10063]
MREGRLRLYKGAAPRCSPEQGRVKECDPGEVAMPPNQAASVCGGVKLIERKRKLDRQYGETIQVNPSASDREITDKAGF